MNSDQLDVCQFLARARQLFPSREIVSRQADGSVTRLDVAEYAARVDRLRWALGELGVTRGDRVATLAWNDHRHLELYMAIPSSGAVLHTVNARLDAVQIGEVVAHAGDRVLFVDPSLVELALEATRDAGQLSHVVVLGDLPSSAPASWLAYEDLLAGQPDTPPPVVAIDENAPAAMCYSSATTGAPKGVTYSHRALYLHSAMLSMADTWALSHRDSVMPIVPMFHVNAWGIPFTALWMGAKIVLPGPRPAAVDLADLLRDEGVTFSAAVPTVWMDVLDVLARRRTALPRLRMLISGGGPLPAGLLDSADALGLPLTHSYGMTEAAPLTNVNRCKHGLESEGTEARTRRRLRQGLLVPGLRMRIVDSDGVEVPWDGITPGELHLRGPWVAESYFEDERSRSSFADGWYRTGDIVTVDREGYLLIVDRRQDLIKSGGEWISSIALESAFTEHEDVARAAAIAVPDPRWQERPMVFVQAQPGREIDAANLRSWLEGQLPRWWIPERIEVVEAIPVTSVGKIDKNALRSSLPVESDGAVAIGTSYQGEA